MVRPCWKYLLHRKAPTHLFNDIDEDVAGDGDVDGDGNGDGDGEELRKLQKNLR